MKNFKLKFEQNWPKPLLITSEKWMAVVEDNIKHVTCHIITMTCDMHDMAAHTTKKIVNVLYYSTIICTCTIYNS